MAYGHRRTAQPGLLLLVIDKNNFSNINVRYRYVFSEKILSVTIELEV